MIESNVALTAVRTAVAEALGIGEDEVEADAAIFADLGAESIDLLDILFRVERKLGVKLKAADIAAHVQGGIPDEVFGNDDGTVSAAGLAYLETVMPQIDTSALAGKLRAEEVINLFTVRNLADLVASRAPTTVG